MVSMKKVKEVLGDKKFGSLIQFVKFGLVGLSNTVVSYVLNIGILLLLRDAMWKEDYIFANVISFTLSIFWSFYWNNRFVFKQEEGQKRNVWKALGKSFLAYGFTGYILNNILSFIWIECLAISKYIAPLLNLVLSIPINFLMNKLWAFKSQ